MGQFNFTTAGESHGKGLVAIIEGLPAGLPVDSEFINHHMWRRQQGYGRGGRMKIERDEVEIMSGVRHGKTLGSPVAILIRNRDFDNWQDVMNVEPREFADEKRARRLTRPRPGHTDLAGGLKYDTHDLRDILERASARETAARVAVGAFARLLIKEIGIEVSSHTAMIGGVPNEPLSATWEQIVAIPDDSPLRCVDTEVEKRMIALIDEAKEHKDTLGGIFEVVACGVIAGLGSHIQWRSKIDGRLAQAIMCIPAVKAVEVGVGVEVSRLTGSQVHDEIGYNQAERRFTRPTNRAGGIEGGITNGEEVRIRGHLKPISTLRRPLASVDVITKEASEAAFERSDIAAVTAAGVIGEAMVAIVLADTAREKFGGDSLSEMKRNFEGYVEQIRRY
ncbi:MAG TPA: chorismate synthase [Blastocatellia bacterium]|jgi:chorismate synthase|nr:chorismate synthase [Blastocatellia bacterium]